MLHGPSAIAEFLVKFVGHTHLSGMAEAIVFFPILYTDRLFQVLPKDDISPTEGCGYDCTIH